MEAGAGGGGGGGRERLCWKPDSKALTMGVTVLSPSTPGRVDLGERKG